MRTTLAFNLQIQTKSTILAFSFHSQVKAFTSYIIPFIDANEPVDKKSPRILPPMKHLIFRLEELWFRFEIIILLNPLKFKNTRQLYKLKFYAKNYIPFRFVQNLIA